MPYGPVTLGAPPATSGPDGVRLPDGTLAGSALALDQAVRNLVAYGGTGRVGAVAGGAIAGGAVAGGSTEAQVSEGALAAAVRAASAHPARLLGDAERGRIAPGAAADLVLLDEAAEVVATVVGGRVAHDRRRVATHAARAAG
jgi:N-acetylglucosamine-6-phosphate deacetylase